MMMHTKPPHNNYKSLTGSFFIMLSGKMQITMLIYYLQITIRHPNLNTGKYIWPLKIKFLFFVYDHFDQKIHEYLK